MSGAQPGAKESEQVDAVMLAARVLVAITARSMAVLEEQLTLPQLRVLVMVERDGPLNLGAVARGLGVHPSNATRACDRLVAAGLLHRGEDVTDRRNLVLELTAQGNQLIQMVTRHRRIAIQEVLDRMPDQHRRELVPVLQAFAHAAGETYHSGAWTLDWTTKHPVGDGATRGSSTS
ncbi:MAG: MarR family winged helix-turn-helix transcriptional regulator [Pseudonocardiaceae bacterium]